MILEVDAALPINPKTHEHFQPQRAGSFGETTFKKIILSFSDHITRKNVENLEKLIVTRTLGKTVFQKKNKELIVPKRWFQLDTEPGGVNHYNPDDINNPNPQ